METDPYLDYICISLEKLQQGCGEQPQSSWGLIERDTEYTFGAEGINAKLLFSLESIVNEVARKERLRNWPPELLFVIFWIENVKQKLFMNYCIFNRPEVNEITASCGI